MSENQLAALEQRYLDDPDRLAVEVPPGQLSPDSSEYAHIYSNLCDAVIQVFWPEQYGTGPDDPDWHTSNRARFAANVLMVAAGYRPNRDEAS